MSGISISPYFPFRRIKIIKQAVDPAATKAVIDVVPDQRFQPDLSYLWEEGSPVSIAGPNARYGI